MGLIFWFHSRPLTLSLFFNELVTSLLLAALVYLSIASYWHVLSTVLFPHIILHTLSLNILSPAKHFMGLLQLINFWWTFKAFQYGHVRTWYWTVSTPLSLLSWGFMLCLTIVLYYFSVLWIFLHCSGFLNSHFCLAGIACSPKPLFPFICLKSCQWVLVFSLIGQKWSLISPLITRNVHPPPKKFFGLSYLPAKIYSE